MGRPFVSEAVRLDHAAPKRRAVVTDGIVGQHTIRTCSPGVKAPSLRSGPRCAGLSALTPAPRALRTGNCPTMPAPDPPDANGSVQRPPPDPAVRSATGRILQRTIEDHGMI